MFQGVPVKKCGFAVFFIKTIFGKLRFYWFHVKHFAAVGGAGALLSKSILSSEVIAYDDLGTEAIRKLEVKDFPAIVVIDKDGNNLYETAVKEYNTLS